MGVIVTQDIMVGEEGHEAVKQMRRGSSVAVLETSSLCGWQAVARGNPLTYGVRRAPSANADPRGQCFRTGCRFHGSLCSGNHHGRNRRKIISAGGNVTF